MSKKRCQHGRWKCQCADCGGCAHGKRKGYCSECDPCPHGNVKYTCKACNPCPHGNVKCSCKACNGCPHGKVRRKCAKCSPCPHGKLKQSCSTCNGCVHGKLKYTCKRCKLLPSGAEEIIREAAEAVEVAPPAADDVRRALMETVVPVLDEGMREMVRRGITGTEASVRFLRDHMDEWLRKNE